MKKLAILGFTGSIGRQTLDIVAHNSQQFDVVSIADGHNIDLARHQALQFKPQLVSVATR